MISLVIDGRPEGKGRPRLGNAGRIYTPKATVLAEGRITDAWINAGRPRIDGPLEIVVALSVARPKGHYRKDGSLSADGLRKPWPTGKKPDVDNALKLVMDALNGKAYRDDVDVVKASVSRQWSESGWEQTRVWLSALHDLGVSVPATERAA